MDAAPSTSADLAQFTTPPGGVMTREVGAITGAVEAFLDPTNPTRLRIRYQEALDVYTVTGPTRGRTLADLVTQLSADPGHDVDGNPAVTSLA